jgi:anaerobic magnesium-protoporphyrin IX monomethyl ester cyclase
MILDFMPDDIGVSVSYPLPGTEFYDIVKSQLSQKSNWTDSDDLALMFQNTFNQEYYKTLHRYIHKIFRNKQAEQTIKNNGITSISGLKATAKKVYYKPIISKLKEELKSLSNIKN